MTNRTFSKLSALTTTRVRLLFMAVLAVPASALAHHPLGGATPANFVEGLLSGLGHPVIGFDHFAFILVAAVFAWLLGRAILAMLVFIGMSALAVFATSQGLVLPAVESGVLLSLAMAGLALMLALKVPAFVSLVFMGAAGLFHGAAYGDAIIGAEATPLVAYLTGIVVAQAALAVLGVVLVRAFTRRSVEPWLAGRCAGAIALGISLAYGVERLESVVFGV